MKKRVLILYSTAGMGHKKAADAIYGAFKKQGNVSVENIDVLDLASGFYRFIYTDFYVFLMAKAKWLWGTGYYLTNAVLFDIITRGIRNMSDFYGLKALCDAIRKRPPDAIIATHFFLPSIAGYLKEDRRFTSRLYTVVTDYGPHSFWLSQHVNRYFVGSDYTAKKLTERNISPRKISSTGIPAGKEFSKNLDTDRIKKKYGLDSSRKTVFLMSGGFGVGPLGRILFSLDSCKAEIQVITVCGHNKQVYDNIKGMKDKLGYPVVLFGFTDKVAELMSVSDIMITKAGGISTTEALNSSLPMILFGSIPGQESWNEKFLLKNDAAEKASRIDDIPVIADRMLISEDSYEFYVNGINKVRRPDAAEIIMRTVLKDMNE